MSHTFFVSGCFLFSRLPKGNKMRRNSPYHVPVAVSVLAFGLVVCSHSVLATWPTDPSVNLPIATNPYSHQSPRIVPDGAGGAIVVWEDIRFSAVDSMCCDGDIFGQRVNGAGELLWMIDGEPIGRAEEGYNYGPRSPQIVSDGVFGAIVAWEDNRSGTSWDVYAQRVDPFGQRTWMEDGIPVCTAVNDQIEIQMTSDVAGGAIIAWRDFRTDSLGNIYAQRVNAAGSVLWAPDGVPVCTAGREQQEARLVTDGTGGAIIVWWDQRNKFAGSADDIFAQRVDAGGTVLWSTNGVPICTAPNRQLQPDIASDGEGGAIITWTDERGDSDIYAQRVDANGNTLWTTNGVGVCTVVNSQRAPDIIADGWSGAILCWVDRRNGGSVYANRIDNMGDVLWVTDGVPAVLGNAGYPELASDGRGGAIMVFHHGHTPARDIYAQRMDGNGTALWTDGGVAISTANDDQNWPRLVPDSQGGAIVIWEDGRDGGSITHRYRVYAQRVDSTGGLTTPTEIPSAQGTLRVLPNVPNPFNALTVLPFELASPSNVRIDIFDVAGRRVFSLKLGERPKGVNHVVLSVEYASGKRLPSGVYFAKVSAGRETQTRKLVIAR